MHKMAPKQWDAMLDVHVTAPFRLIQAAAPHMRGVAKEEMEREGRAHPRCILTVSSVSGAAGQWASVSAPSCFQERSRFHCSRFRFSARHPPPPLHLF